MKQATLAMHAKYLPKQMRTLHVSFTFLVYQVTLAAVFCIKLSNRFN